MREADEVSESGGMRPLRILVVCTGNICRSPMAEGILRARAAAAGLDAQVASVGTHAVVGPADPQAIRAMRARDIDITSHVARQFAPVDLAASDLVLTMERAHVVELVAAEPGALDRTFTLPEFVRLAGGAATPTPAADGSAWLGRLAERRDPHALLRSDPADEVDDPYGRGRRAFDRCADHLDELCAGIIDLLTR